MRLDGSLEGFSLPDIVALLTASRKSGALHLSHEARHDVIRHDVIRHGVIRLVDGAVSGASSDTARQSLVRRLIGTGHLTDEVVSAGVARVRADHAVGLARALQDADAVEKSLLLDAARGHAVDALFDMLQWTDGSFRFGAGDYDVDDVGLRESAEELFAAAGQRMEAWQRLSLRIPSSAAVLRLAVAPAHDPVLTRDDWAVVSMIDGRRSIGDLVSWSGRCEPAVVAVLAPLVERGLLEVTGGSNDDEVATGLAHQQQLVASLEQAPVSDRAAGDTGPNESARPQTAQTAQTAQPVRSAPEPAATEQVVVLEPGVNRSMLLRLIAAAAVG